MKIFYDENIHLDSYTAVTLGNFDGIHIGHQKLINTVKKYAYENNLTSVVFSFYPHPMSVFNDNNEFYTILNSHEKEYIMSSLGIDVLIQYPFSAEFASLSPQNFIDILFQKIMCRVLVIGENYCFGKNREGNFNTLYEFGLKNNMKVIKVSHVNDKNERISSTRIRKCIADKNFDDANRLLNKPYFIMGKIVQGKKIGRTIGFPTVNLTVNKNKLLPPDGVYITRTFCDGEIFNSITNIGKNPTVNGIKKTVETYIFDFNDEIYGKEIRVCFYKWIRGEIKFNNVEELKIQISKDKAAAKIYFSSTDSFITI